MKYLKQSVNHQVWSLIKSNPCCDHVVITENECDVLKKMFNIKLSDHVPCDLLISNTIPIKDLKITLTDRAENSFTSDIHIWGCPDQETLQKEKVVSVGAIQISINEFVMIDVEYGKNTIYHGYVGIAYDDNASYLKAFKQHMEWRRNYKFNTDGMDCDEFVARYTGMMMEVFYTIQVALLHPTTKELFRKPSLSVVKDEKKKLSSKKKRVTKYVKKYYIDPKELDSITVAAKQTGSTRTYSCLAWYVCGHWRKYKNGSQVFIQPYWKGVMRNKREFVENLERYRKIDQLKEQR